VPDVDAQLLRFARGIDDLRWMLWLEGQAKNGGEAAALLARMRAAVPGRWAIDDQPKVDLAALRHDLATVARQVR